MYVLAIYVIIFACLTVLLIKEFKHWGNGESQSLHWLWWTLYQSSSMTKGAACSLAPCLRCQPPGKSTIIGLPARLQGLVGEWGGMQLGPYPSALTYSPKKFSPSSACQIVRTWEEITFHCQERFLSRRGSWTEKQPGLERPFQSFCPPLQRCLIWGTGKRQQRCCINRRFLAVSDGCWTNFCLQVHLREASLWARKWDAVVLSLPASWKTLHGFYNDKDYFIIIIIIIIL